MKKIMQYVVVMVVALVLIGCKQEAEQNGIVDLSKENKSYGVVSDEQAYGPIVHQGVLVEKVRVQSVKLDEHMYAYGIYLKSKDKYVQAIALVCNLRTNAAGFQHNLKNDENYVPKGDFELSLMNYRAGVMDIREADEGSTPVFSTTSDHNNLITALRGLDKLDPHSTVAFTVDKEEDDGYTKAIAWSYLIPVDKLINALGKINTPCEGVPVAMDEQHVFGIDKQ